MKLRTDDKLYIVELFLLFGICMSIMLQEGPVTSFLFKITFVVVLAAFLLQMYHRQIINELHLLAIATIVLTFLHVAMQSENNSFSYYKKFIIFSSTVMMIPIAEGMTVKRWQVKWILGLNICIALMYPVMYWIVGVGGYLGRYLTMQFTNPNLTAMYLMHSLLYSVLAFYYFRHWLLRGLLLVPIGAIAWLNYQTGARSTLVSLSAFAFFVFFNLILKKNVKISKTASRLFLWLPLIVSVGYMVLNYNGMLEQVLEFLDGGEGKRVGSRVDVWETALEAYFSHPILGDYHGISLGSGMSQLHNTHLDTLASYGTVPFLMFMALLTRGVNKIMPLTITNFSRLSLFAFYTVIIQGTFEAALVAGGVGLYILSFGFLIIAKCNENDETR